ncbi:hypothetical protein [Candidatus Finniella inopinata]|uniref:Uncharacterized protein n=1 Tax=Candidatus Finniella inopinata TaxID=1696036 RepID=A0A4Q7DIF2_9PROT|nr:hypothetical protein [Candidatus Finniella inopinata]RZI46140.1 hypothetical protein EQU50_04185 [Candidatus Finniella inopinata]
MSLFKHIAFIAGLLGATAVSAFDSDYPIYAHPNQIGACLTYGNPWGSQYNNLSSTQRQYTTPNHSTQTIGQHSRPVSAADASGSDVSHDASFMAPGGPVADHLLACQIRNRSLEHRHQIIDRQITATWEMLRNNASPNLFADIGKAISGYFYENVYIAPAKCSEAILKTTGETYGETLSLLRDFQRKMKRDGKIADPLTFLLECEGLRSEHKLVAIVAGVGFQPPKSDDISEDEKSRRWDYFEEHFGSRARIFMRELQDALPKSIQRKKASLLYNMLTKVSASLIYNIFTYQAPQRSPASKLTDDLLRNVLEFAYGPLKYSLDTTLFLRARLLCSIPTQMEFSKKWWAENTREARYQSEEQVYVAAGNPATSFHQAFMKKYGQG